MKARTPRRPNAIRKWDIIKTSAPRDLKIFEARWRVSRSPRTGQKHTVLVLNGANWVNVIALTPRREVVLIEQYRHGIDQVTLEIPGGIINEGEHPATAGARELREETGFVGVAARVIGVVHPNPAFQSNVCYTVLVTDARRTARTEFDTGEDIMVRLTPIKTTPELIRTGRITHSLVIAAFHLFRLLNIRGSPCML